jgi:hypothetical protein
MEVKCPHGGDDVNAESNKRARGNDGDAVAQDGCNWTGKCHELNKYNEKCELTVITCCLDGCGHECSRRDMVKHLSGEGFLRHMNLMKACYDKKIDNNTREITQMKRLLSTSNARFTVIQRELNESKEKIKSMQTKISLLESKVRSSYNDNENGEREVIVKECDVQEINGVFKQFGEYNGTFIYSKSGVWEGEEVTFKMYRYDAYDGKHWFISILAGGKTS